MAVYKSKDAFRVKPWCVDIYKGSTRVKRYFKTQDEAIEEEARLTLSPVSKKGWDRIKVGYLVEKYRDEIVPTLAGYNADNPKVDPTTYRLNRILKEQPGTRLCGYSLSDLTHKVQAWEYIRARQRQDTNRGTKVNNRTISRERNLLQRVFATAIEEWGYVGLTNPFADITLKGSKHRRTRRLEQGEYEQLINSIREGCYGINKFYVCLAVDIAIDTGMREDEIFYHKRGGTGLQWRDINFEKRQIKVRKSKTDHLQEIPGRTIVLPFRTLVDLVCIKATLEYDGVIIKPTHRIFPMTERAIIQAFEKARDRAGIEDLTYRDLRHEAASRWDELEPALTKPQIAMMHGHSGKDTTDIYINSELREIRKKLDRQVLGMLFEEKFPLDGKTIYETIKAEYWQEPAALYKTRKEAEETINNLVNDTTPPSKEVRDNFAKIKEFDVKVLEYGDNPTREQLLELLNLIPDNLRLKIEPKPAEKVTKLRLIRPPRK